MSEHTDPSTWGVECQIGTVPQDLVDAAIEATRGGSGRYRMLDLDEGELYVADDPLHEFVVRIPWADQPTGIWGSVGGVIVEYDGDAPVGLRAYVNHDQYLEAVESIEALGTWPPLLREQVTPAVSIDHR
jgi:hypothetical protein